MTQLSRSAMGRMLRLILVFVMILSLVGGFFYSAQAKNIYNIKADANVVTTVEGFALDSDSDAVQQLLDQAGIQVSATDVIEVTTQSSQGEGTEADSSAQTSAPSPAPSDESDEGEASASQSVQAEDADASQETFQEDTSNKDVPTAEAHSKEGETVQNKDAATDPADESVVAADQSIARAETVSEAEQNAASAENASQAEQSAAQTESVPQAGAENTSKMEQSAESSQGEAADDVQEADGTVETDPADEGADSSAESSASAAEGDNVITVTVKRPKYVTVTVDKTLTTVQLQEGDTVRDVVNRLNIVLGENDLISQELDAAPDPQQPITINRVELSYFTKEKTEKYDTIRKADPDSYIGTEYVKREGRNYKKVDTYEKKIIDGGKPIITKIKTDVTKKKDEIVCYGTKVDSPSPSGLSASQLVITNRDEENGTITLSDGSSYSYYSVSDSFSATAYTGGGTTSTGRAAQVGVVAVDPSVIPYGTRMYITSGSTVYGVCVAGDTGVHGHLIDLYFNSGSQCRSFGRRGITVYFLD